MFIINYNRKFCFNNHQILQAVVYDKKILCGHLETKQYSLQQTIRLKSFKKKYSAVNRKNHKQLRNGYNTIKGILKIDVSK